ncbi:MAG TPA: hypothetical protein VFG29_06835 [Syntrophales bacterium]|nr:hypothetical protein [Syntrophales bacterium]
MKSKPRFELEKLLWRLLLVLGLFRVAIYMKTISVEVVSNFFTTYSHCTRCEAVFRESGLGKEANRGDIEDYPAELKEEIIKISDRIDELKRLYKHRIQIRLTDAQSPRGIYKSLIHRLRRYPAFIIEKKDVYIGWDRERIDELIDKYLRGTGS